MMEGEDLPNEEITKNSTNPPELLTTADFEHLRPVHVNIPYPEMAGVTIDRLDDLKQFLGRFVVVYSSNFYICKREAQVYGYLKKHLTPYSAFTSKSGRFKGYSLKRLIPAESVPSECALSPGRIFKISVPTQEQYEDILEKLRSGWEFEYSSDQLGVDEVNAQRMKLN